MQHLVIPRPSGCQEEENGHGAMGRRAVDSKGGQVITLDRHKALGSLLYSVGIDPAYTKVN